MPSCSWYYNPQCPDSPSVVSAGPHEISFISHYVSGLVGLTHFNALPSASLHARPEIAHVFLPARPIHSVAIDWVLRGFQLFLLLHTGPPNPIGGKSSFPSFSSSHLASSSACRRVAITLADPAVVDELTPVPALRILATSACSLCDDECGGLCPPFVCAAPDAAVPAIAPAKGWRCVCC